MPIGKRRQSNAMLYTLIAFVGLFITATTVAVIYYVKFEEQADIAQTAQNDLEKMISGTEQRKGVGRIVGAIPRNKSALGTMSDYLDEMVYLVIAGPAEDTSAEVKVDTVKRRVKETLELLAQGGPAAVDIDPNTTALTRIMEKLKIGLDNVTSTKLASQQQLQELQNRFDDVMTANREKEQSLLAEKEKYQQQVNDIVRDYNDLKALMQQASQQRVQTLMTQLDEEKATRKQQQQLLLKTQAKLKMSEDRMKRTQNTLEKLLPPPDSEVPAFKADGKIMLVDDQAGIVYLNIGSSDHVYRGLTFSVYEKNMPIPRDGKGKSEIKVFNIEKNISAARITSSQKGKTIVADDIVANLIWDSDRTNTFVVSGELDLNNDGNIDYGAAEVLIERWGGKVSDTVSIDTDFVILGSAPSIGRKPTFEEIGIHPSAMKKYETSMQRLADYNEVQRRAQELSIPIFNTERFLYFIGYKTQSLQPGAF